jgi:hypothetical protein
MISGTLSVYGELLAGTGARHELGPAACSRRLSGRLDRQAPVLSLVIGAILAGFGFTPTTLPSRFLAAARSVWSLGFDAVRNAGAYF